MFVVFLKLDVNGGCVFVQIDVPNFYGSCLLVSLQQRLNKERDIEGSMSKAKNHAT